MEELDHLSETTARIKKILEGSTQQVYIIETHNGYGVPKFNDQWLDDKVEIKEWKQFQLLLKDLNVNKILLGGMLFDIQDRFPDKDNLHYGKQLYDKGAKDREWYATDCVGRVANNLAANFNIEISNFTWPTNRRKFHERIGRTKLI